MSFTQAEAEARFVALDATHFGGRLAATTFIELIVPMRGNRLAQPEDGACKSDGSIVYLNPRSGYDWESTLLHEMVHAFEYRFGDEIIESAEARQTEKKYPPHPFYGGHSAKFFTKLFEVIRARGEDPNVDLLRYFD